MKPLHTDSFYVIPQPQQVAEAPSAGVDIVSLFEAEEQALLRYAHSFVHRREIAEEVVQEVFLKLHAKWDSVRQPRAWLYRSVRNRCYNYSRDHSREVLVDDEGLDQRNCAAGVAPDSQLQQGEAAGRMREMLADLEPDDRRLIEMKYDEDLSYAEIGERLGITAGNVGYRLHHLLKRLADQLRDAGIDTVHPKPTTPTI